jgi:hypothetical protein
MLGRSGKDRKLQNGFSLQKNKLKLNLLSSADSAALADIANGKIYEAY